MSQTLQKGFPIDRMIEIRDVSWNESKEELLSVRLSVFVEEQGVPEEIEQDQYDPISFHFLAIDENGSAVGTARLLPNGKIGRVAVLGHLRGLGIGSAIMKKVIFTWNEKVIPENPSESPQLSLHAQTSSIPFYESLGFVASGREFDEAGIPHRAMVYRREVEE